LSHNAILCGTKGRSPAARGEKITGLKGNPIPVEACFVTDMPELRFADDREMKWLEKLFKKPDLLRYRRGSVSSPLKDEAGNLGGSSILVN
jgi:hypothetical protein